MSLWLTESLFFFAYYLIYLIWWLIMCFRL